MARVTPRGVEPSDLRPPDREFLGQVMGCLQGQPRPGGARTGFFEATASWIDEATADDRHVVVSSRILRTELTRVLRHEGLPVNRRDEILDVVALVPVTEGVLAASEAVEPHVKTPDAIHLGSVIAAGLDATIVGHDAGMIAAATSLGYPTLDPVKEGWDAALYPGIRQTMDGGIEGDDRSSPNAPAPIAGRRVAPGGWGAD